MIHLEKIAFKKGEKEMKIKVFIQASPSTRKKKQPEYNDES